MLELCCGSAQLTAACIDEGLSAAGADWNNRFDTHAPWVKVNLADMVGCGQILQVIEQSASILVVVWFGLPCGTASRAHDIQDCPRLPPELRSEQFPLGLPGLVGDEPPA